jgi:hypothetical protein
VDMPGRTELPLVMKPASAGIPKGKPNSRNAPGVGPATLIMKPLLIELSES